MRKSLTRFGGGAVLTLISVLLVIAMASPALAVGGPKYFARGSCGFFGFSDAPGNVATGWTSGSCAGRYSVQARKPDTSFTQRVYATRSGPNTDVGYNYATRITFGSHFPCDDCSRYNT